MPSPGSVHSCGHHLPALWAPRPGHVYLAPAGPFSEGEPELFSTFHVYHADLQPQGPIRHHPPTIRREGRMQGEAPSSDVAVLGEMAIFSSTKIPDGKVARNPIRVAQEPPIRGGASHVVHSLSGPHPPEHQLGCSRVRSQRRCLRLPQGRGLGPPHRTPEQDVRPQGKGSSHSEVQSLHARLHPAPPG